MSGEDAALGWAWVFGDKIDTDVLAPGHLMKLSAEDLATHCLEAIAPDFASQVRPGDVIVAGSGFGIGSSREQAAVSLKILGVRAILAVSYARIFWRNALNLGLPALIMPEAGEIGQGDLVSVDAASGRIENRTSGRVYQVQKLPPHLLQIIGEGGLMPYLKARYGARASRPHKSWHERGYLPHFDSGAAIQTITFRLADSLPREAYEEAVAASADDSERRRRLDAIIDAGRGSCLLGDAENAAIVRDALGHFDGERYRLLAWAVMPNHVHVMIEQIDGFPLGEVVHSWKSFTAKAINRRRGSTGAVWAPDYFDRFIRDEAHYAAAIRYIEGNPVKAGLARVAAEWLFSSAHERAGGTPALPPKAGSDQRSTRNCAVCR